MAAFLSTCMLVWQWNIWTQGMSDKARNLLTVRSLDYIYRKNGPIQIEIVGKVAEAVLKGLMYLYDVHRIIHRGESIIV